MESHFSDFHFGTLNISNSEFEHYNPTSTTATPSTTSTASSDKHTYGESSRNTDVHGSNVSTNVGNSGVAPGTTATATGNVSFGTPYLHGSPFLPSAMYHPFAYATDPTDNSLRGPFMTMYDQQAYQAALYQQRDPSSTDQNKFNPNTASTSNQSTNANTVSSGSNGTTSPTPSQQQQQQQQNPFGYASMYPAQYPYMASQYASYQATGPSQYYTRPPAYIRGYPPNYTASSGYPTGPTSGNPIPESYADLTGVPMPQEFKNTVYPMTTSYYPVSGNADVSQMLPPSAKPPQHQLPSQQQQQQQQQGSNVPSASSNKSAPYSTDNTSNTSASYNNQSKSSQNPQDYKNYQQSGPNYYMPAQQFGNQPSQNTASTFAYGYPTRPQQYNQQ